MALLDKTQINKSYVVVAAAVVVVMGLKAHQLIWHLNPT
jgi:hypothetical protein